MVKFKNILIILVIMILSLSFSIKAFEISVDKEVYVKDSNILLKDIAEFNNISKNDLKNIQNLELGKSPLPGYKKYINKELFKLLIKKLGYNKNQYNLNIPNQVVVKRKSRQVNSTEVESHIKRYLSNILDDITDEYSISVNFRQKQITIPDKQYSIEIIGDREIKTGKMTVPTAVIIDNNEYKRFYVPVEIKAFKKAYVAKRYISQGSKINRDDYEFKLVEIDSLDDSDIIKKDTDLFNNKVELSYSLKQGDILKKNNYNTTYLINWGDQIQAQVIVGDIELSLMVTARERGKMGEYVKVENPKNNHQFNAKVISPQLVQVIKD
ncbi:MAG: flagellar basal body P-ring formation chaperone FlgA [Halanaerobiales bacterium]|nr:flagellar basal body P-ring formation chaperone FlgA [Halanaerobiales bacterium]